MTTITSDPAPTGSLRRPFPVFRVALAAFLLGVAVFAVGARLVWLSVYDLPYQQSQTSAAPDGDQYRDQVEIRTDDGRTYRFTGDPSAANDWVGATTARLDDDYGLDDRKRLGDTLVAIGTLLGGCGLVLAAGGAVARVRRGPGPGSRH